MSVQNRQTPRIRALFLDVDGTLVDARETISPRVRAAIAAAAGKGCHISLCTGRTWFRTIPIAERLEPTIGHLITSNGAVLRQIRAATPAYRLLLSRTLALEVTRALVSYGIAPYVFEDSDVPGEEGARVLYHPDFPPGPWATFPRYRPSADILNALPFDPVSVSAFGPAGQIRQMIAPLREQFGHSVSIQQSGTDRNWGIEIYDAAINKRAGIEALTGLLGVAQEETMAIGDHLNDLEMIAWAGVGVAMGNAQPEVCDAADWVTGTLDEDGVATAIARFLPAS